MLHPRSAAALTLIVMVSACTALFDYGDEGSGGTTVATGGSGGVGGSVTTGGQGGGADCTTDDDCDDANSCTVDSCSSGSCDNLVLSDGEPCTNGSEGGTCTDGTCLVACSEANPSVCDDTNPCTVDSCDLELGQCVNEAVADGPAEDDLQTAGDCNELTCLSGVPTDVIDDDDLPVDGNACTQDLCNAGRASNPNEASGVNCGGALVCDGNGVCVGCNEAADCPGQSTFCVTITCIAQQCGAENTTDGTPLPPPEQTAGVCKEVQCNGMGGTKIANQTNGSTCDDNLHCNGADTCLSGNCSQHAGDPCPGADNDGDCSESCNETADDCSASDTNGTTCDDGLYCNGSDTCQGGACSNHSGDPCTGADGDSNCAESCNESNDSCNGADPNGSSCNDGLYCNGNDTCQNGDCTGHAGNPCPGPDGDNDCSESCNEVANNCTSNDIEGSGCFMGGTFGCCFNGNCFSNCP